jgi:isopenicillin-N N-acyltransferase-like protein
MDTAQLLSRRDLLAAATASGLSAALSRLTSAAPRVAPLPFPELEAMGSPGTLGLIHGRAFSPQIGRNVGFYLPWLAKTTGSDQARLLALARAFAPVLGRHAPAQLEEIEGIAKGSGRSRDEILLLNARSDLLVLGRRRVRGVLERPAAPPPSSRQVRREECTSLALPGVDDRGRPLLALGQNWDWQRELAKGTVLLRLRPTGKPRLVTFTEAGMVAKIGFNEQRLGVCLNFLGHKSEDPEAEPAVPVHCLLRAVLSCSTLEEAFKLVAWAPRCASANFLLAQHGARGPVALDLELTPSAIGRLALRAEGLIHANHFKDPALAPGCESGPKGSTGNRDRTATELARKLARSVRDPVERLRQILVLRAGAPLSVSKTRTAASTSETLAGIIMDLSRNRLHLAAGASHAAPFVLRPGT